MLSWKLTEKIEKALEQESPLIKGWRNSKKLNLRRYFNYINLAKPWKNPDRKVHS